MSAGIGDAYIAILAMVLIVSTVLGAVYLEIKAQTALQAVPDIRGLAVYSNGILNVTLEQWKGLPVSVCYIELRTDIGGTVINVTGGYGTSQIDTVNVTATLHGFIGNKWLGSGVSGVIEVTFDDTTALFSGKSYPVIIYDCDNETVFVAHFTAP